MKTSSEKLDSVLCSTTVVITVCATLQRLTLDTGFVSPASSWQWYEVSVPHSWFVNWWRWFSHVQRWQAVLSREEAATKHLVQQSQHWTQQKLLPFCVS